MSNTISSASSSQKMWKLDLHTSTKAHLQDIQKNYERPTNSKSQEEKAKDLKQEFEKLLSLKTDGTSKTRKDRTAAETKLDAAIKKLPESSFKTEALRVFGELLETSSSNSGNPGNAIPQSWGYAYDHIQLQSLDIRATSNLKAPIQETRLVVYTKHAGVTLGADTNVSAVVQVDDTAQVQSLVSDRKQEAIQEFVAGLRPELTAENMRQNELDFLDFIEELEDIHATDSLNMSAVDIITPIMDFIAQRIADDGSQAAGLMATREAFKEMVLHRFDVVLVPGQNIETEVLATKPNGVELMRDKTLSFQDKLSYLADVGDGLQTLHALGTVHGNFSMANTVQHRGHGVLVGSADDSVQYPSVEILKARSAGEGEVRSAQQDVFAFGVELFHATVDKTVPAMPGLVQNDYLKFPPEQTASSVKLFLKGVRRLEEGMLRQSETHPMRAELANLIHDCTRQDPRARIGMDVAVARLRDIVDKYPDGK